MLYPSINVILAGFDNQGILKRNKMDPEIENRKIFSNQILRNSLNPSVTIPSQDIS